MLTSGDRDFSHKLSTLATKQGEYIEVEEPMLVRIRRQLFGLIPLPRMSAKLWIHQGESGWHAMVSDTKSGPFIGADYDGGGALAKAWIWELKIKHWIEVTGMRALEVDDRIRHCIVQAYDQHCADGT